MSALQTLGLAIIYTHPSTVHLSISSPSPLSSIFIHTLSHHPFNLPLFLPPFFLPHVPLQFLHTLNLSHHLLLSPFLFCIHYYLSLLLSYFLSPDITSNHILYSSLLSSLSTHPSLPVCILSPLSFWSPLLQTLDQAHYLHYIQYTHQNQFICHGQDMSRNLFQWQR